MSTPGSWSIRYLNRRRMLHAAGVPLIRRSGDPCPGSRLLPRSIGARSSWSRPWSRYGRFKTLATHKSRLAQMFICTKALPALPEGTSGFAHWSAQAALGLRGPTKTRTGRS
eukprot:scaffold245_cov323-Prasinococcus_capsulatus_cf.AAC.1